MSRLNINEITNFIAIINYRNIIIIKLSCKKRTATNMERCLPLVFFFVLRTTAVPVDLRDDARLSFANVKIPINISVPPVVLIPVKFGCKLTKTATN